MLLPCVCMYVCMYVWMWIQELYNVLLATVTCNAHTSGSELSRDAMLSSSEVKWSGRTLRLNGMETTRRRVGSHFANIVLKSRDFQCAHIKYINFDSTRSFAYKHSTLDTLDSWFLLRYSPLLEDQHFRYLASICWFECSQLVGSDWIFWLLH